LACGYSGYGKGPMGVTGNVYASRCGKEKWNLEEEAFSLFIW